VDINEDGPDDMEGLDVAAHMLQICCRMSLLTVSYPSKLAYSFPSINQ
jgi:hypothetical protein